ncbi:transferase hexapeptide (six repeat-containing protein) [Salegentibacter echinorum]|uniref:Transferase hexapeptide (Six repeat-containing protein) n=1 Tax=Salegentibacter echinorum TaxID=1073325 RepID=A0A1M5FIX7_SALEC|nr:acyltransferase [Salegentibacter echinorum]SHF91428.1 transferase hexapeptide (six repeat-containing protein) [Salegentibacter echinorum]
MQHKSLFYFLKRFPQVSYLKLKVIIKWYLFKIAKNWVILNRISRGVRPAIWKMTGCTIGKNVSIGYDVYYDVSNASYIKVEDGVWIASRCLILCHKRDLTQYYLGEDYNGLSYQKSEVVLKKGCVIGMNSVIMPGVTIGEGAIVGVNSLVVKDVPAWTIAVGNPAKVVKKIEKRSLNRKSI